MKITSLLIRYGYRPDLSKSLDKYEEAISKYLGDEKYDHFCYLRDFPASYDDIFNFVYSDTRLAHLVLSAQIENSIAILEQLTRQLQKLKKFSPNNMLELGGSEGWASEYLLQIKNSIKTSVVLEQVAFFESKSKNVQIIHKKYKDYRPNLKFDFVFSILGAEINDFPDLVETIQRLIHDDGLAFVGLRIANSQAAIRFVELIQKFDLKILNEYSTRAVTDTESFPVFCLKKGKQDFSKNNLLAIVRKNLNGLDTTKVVRDYEAELLLNLIDDGDLLIEKRKEYDGGTWGRIRLLEKENIIYRITDNSYQNLAIEYPINSNEIFDVDTAQSRWDTDLRSNTP